MSPITIGLIVWLVGFLFSMFKFFYVSHAFGKYIKENHPAKWNEMTYEGNLVKKSLFPFSKGTKPYFIYKSKDNLNDHKIAEFRIKIKQHIFFFAIVYPLSLVSYIILVIWFLRTFVK